MTATPPAPAQEPQRDQSTTGLWTVALVLGVIVALLGVSAAVGSVQRKQYSESRVGAVYLLKNGNAIGASMRRLEEVNTADYNLVKETRAALEAGDTLRFRVLVAQAEVNSVEQLRLQQEVQAHQVGFDTVFKP